MKLPPNHTQEQVLAAIENAVSKLANTYKFGFHESEDIKQEGRLFALQFLESEAYDNKRPLENILFVHIRNRLINLKRDKFRRSDTPCLLCHEAHLEGTLSPCEYRIGTKYCARYETWNKRNSSKQNLMNMLDLSSLDSASDYLSYMDSTIEETTEHAEILALIDSELPTEERKTLLKIRAGERVTRQKKEVLEQSVAEILAKKGVSLKREHEN